MFNVRGTVLTNRCFASIIPILIATTMAMAGTESESTMQPSKSTDLIAGGEDIWTSPDWSRWEFRDSKLIGRTVAFPEIPTDDMDATSLLVTRNTFGGDLDLNMDIVFERSRYLGVYLDYDADTDTGMWLATGHPLAPKEDGDMEVEMAYIKTVDEGDWTVRAMGQLDIQPGKTLRLRWVKSGQDYSIWQDDRIIVTYRPERNYDAGVVMFRLMSAVAEIRKLEMTSDWVK